MACDLLLGDFLQILSDTWVDLVCDYKLESLAGPLF
jgi:hypothetical protein